MCANSPFFRRSGFPFFTVANTRSPAPAAGRRFSRPLMPFTAMMYRFLAPVLSAQLITAPTGRPRDILNFAPEAPFFPAFQGHTRSLSKFIHSHTPPEPTGPSLYRYDMMKADYLPRFDILKGEPGGGRDNAHAQMYAETGTEAEFEEGDGRSGKRLY